MCRPTFSSVGRAPKHVICDTPASRDMRVMLSLGLLTIATRSLSSRHVRRYVCDSEVFSVSTLVYGTFRTLQTPQNSSWYCLEFGKPQDSLGLLLGHSPIIDFPRISCIMRAAVRPLPSLRPHLSWTKATDECFAHLLVRFHSIVIISIPVPTCLVHERDRKPCSGMNTGSKITEWNAFRIELIKGISLL
jgi:hypothetical protein